MFLKLSKISLYISLLSVVVVMSTILFPFIGGKDYFFRIAIEASVIFFLLWWSFEDHTEEACRRITSAFKKPLFIAVTVFTVAMLLSTIFALDSHGAFWSNFERGEGTFQFLHYYAMFFLMVVLFKEEKDWKFAFQVSSVAAVGMIAYGVLGVTGWANNFITPKLGDLSKGFWADLIEPRFQGTLGNPAYVAPYLMFSMFYAAYLWASSDKKKKWFAIAGWSLLIAFFFFFFLLSQTRGAMVGFGKWIFTLLALVIVLGSGLVAFRHSSFVTKLPGGRIFDIAFSDDTLHTRLWTWGSAWQGFLERPVFGWGQENFSAVFDKYFDPRHFNPNSNSETWFDRAHSIIFDYLAETGAVGLLSYFSIFAVIFMLIFSKKKDGHEASRAGAVGKALIFAMPIGYLIQGLAIFDVLPMYINLFLFFAFVYYYFYNRSDHLASNK